MVKKPPITISGLTPSAQCSQCCPENILEACFADTLTIGAFEPDIKNILAACVSVTLVDYKILCTAAGKKLVITFLENITVTFTAANCLETKHRAAFCMTRCMTHGIDSDCPVKTVHLFIEDVTVIPMSPRTIGVTSVLSAFPEIRSHRRDEDNSLRYDIKIRSTL